MQIRKTYHFYAAHRNEELRDKCRNLHGHTYQVAVYFEVSRDIGDSVTVLFSDLDSVMEPLIRAYDHGMLIHVSDPLFSLLKGSGEDLKLIEFDRPTSVENLALRMYGEVLKRGLPLVKLEVQETESSTIYYTIFDFRKESGMHTSPDPNASLQRLVEVTRDEISRA